MSRENEVVIINGKRHIIFDGEPRIFVSGEDLLRKISREEDKQLPASPSFGIASYAIKKPRFRGQISITPAREL